MHAKEPKTTVLSRALALFIERLAEMVPAPWVAMVDTKNMATAEIAESFQAQLLKDGQSSVPPPTIDTTSKHRSVLHGQCYSKKKCLVTVKAPKDRLVASADVSIVQVRVFPNIEGGGDIPITLPTPDWATDHCLVSADCILRRAILPPGSTGTE